MAKNEVEVKKENAIVLAGDFEQDASGGFESMGQDDFALPFLRLLTNTSPEVGEVDGAMPGMVFNTVNSTRAALGAYQARFTSVVASLATTAENLTASRSRIQDADFAAETANLSRAQILQQAGTAMVAQANQLPQGVLALLR